VEIDIKKLVALSTLSQISICIVVMGIFCCGQSYLYILVHALFKSLLFIQVGRLIYKSYGQQNINLYVGFSDSLSNRLILIRLMSLCGLIFISRISIKEFILIVILGKENSLLIVLLFLLGICGTYIYCGRILFIIFGSVFKSINISGRKRERYLVSFFTILWVIFFYSVFIKNIFYTVFSNSEIVFVPIILVFFVILS